MASISKRTGKYRVLIRRKGQPPLSQTFLKRTDAEAWARKIESELERGLFLDISSAKTTPFSQVAERYTQEILPSKKSGSVQAYRLQHFVRYFSNRTLDQITPHLVTRYREARLEVVSKQSVRDELSILRRIFKLAMSEWGITLPKGNPVEQVRLPEPSKGRDRRLEPGELEALIDCLPKRGPVREIVLLAVETAMRREEITKMDWRDIDWKKRTLHIPETKTAIPRTIPLSSTAIEILKHRQEKSPAIAGRIFTIQPGGVSHAFKCFGSVGK
ncbi:tyrosine-type recombinase/integrase [Magnetofaba australis]|uniref:tyrosine-type recombinase/integrase n=1 Tax=Magnetofaba australis TaxID=1472297 RepID=UPI000A19DC41|nr:integrase [Magnetofaba australis]